MSYPKSPLKTRYSLVYYKALSWNLYFLVSLLMSFRSMRKTYQMTVTFGRWHTIAHIWKKRYLTNQLRSGIQLVVTIIMVINPIKTKSMTIASRQKHQLSPVPLSLVPRGAKIDQVSEHRLLSIYIRKRRRRNILISVETQIPIMYAKQSQDEYSFCQN